MSSWLDKKIITRNRLIMGSQDINDILPAQAQIQQKKHSSQFISQVLLQYRSPASGPNSMKPNNSYNPFLIAYCFLFVYYGLVSGSIGTLIPLKASQLRLPETDFSLAFVAKGFGSVSGAFLSKFLAELLCYHHLLVLAILLSSLSIFLATQVTSPSMFSLIYFFVDLCVVNFNIICTVAVTRLKPLNFDPWNKSLHFCYALGAFLSPMLASYIGMRAYFMYPIYGAALALVFIYLSTIEPRQLYLPASAPKSSADHTSQSSIHDTQVPFFIECLIGVMLLIYNGSQVSFGGWVNTYAQMSPLVTAKQGLMASSLFWISFSIGRALAVPLSLLLALSKQMVVLLSGLTLSSVASTFLAFGGYEKQAIMLAAGGFGLFMSGLYPSIIGLTSALGMHTTASNTTRIILAGSVGSALLPYITGHILRWTSHNVLIYNQLLYSALLVLLFSVVLLRSPKNIAAQQKSKTQSGHKDVLKFE